MNTPKGSVSPAPPLAGCLSNVRGTTRDVVYHDNGETNKTPGQWKAHGHYLARESAMQKQDIKAVGFSAT
jgi:NADH:ubiquinone oxidoreductase subunit